jgi:DNA-binding transcriptional LysR family regulator
MKTLDDLAVFVEVVQRGSFTATAEHLEVSKAVISKYIGRLEQRLGARLLNRTTRRLTLTEAGEVLYRKASIALADLGAAEAGVMELTGRPRGRLRVSAPSHFGEMFLARMFTEFKQRYPDISLDLDLDNRLVDMVQERFDVAIRISGLRSSSLVARKLADVRSLTCASPAYLKRHGRPSTPAELREHECLNYSLDRTPSEWQYRRPHGRWVAVQAEGSFRCNSEGTLKQAALDGIGILNIPDLFIEQELREGKLVTLLDDYEGAPLSLAAVFPTREHLAPKVRVFVDFLAQGFRR